MRVLGGVGGGGGERVGGGGEEGARQDTQAWRRFPASGQPPHRLVSFLPECLLGGPPHCIRFLLPAAPCLPLQDTWGHSRAPTPILIHLALQPHGNSLGSHPPALCHVVHLQVLTRVFLCRGQVQRQTLFICAGIYPADGRNLHQGCWA